MEPIHLQIKDFGLLCQGRPQCKDYRIEPAKELGRGGFRFSFRDSHPQNTEIQLAEVSGKFDPAPWPLKNYLETHLVFCTDSLQISLIKTSKIKEDFSVNDIPEAVIELLDMIRDYIASAPDPSQKKYYGNHGRYTVKNGDYLFIIGKAPWIFE